MNAIIWPIEFRFEVVYFPWKEFMVLCFAGWLWASVLVLTYTNKPKLFSQIIITVATLYFVAAAAAVLLVWLPVPFILSSGIVLAVVSGWFFRIHRQEQNRLP